MVAAVSEQTISAEAFLSTLPEPHWGPIGKEVYERTYSREKQNGTFEKWINTTARVVDGNLRFVPEDFIEAGERESLLRLMYNFGVLPAGRHLWVTGIPGRQFINNCVRGTTNVLTRGGWKAIKELVGQTVEIVTEEGKWVKASFKSFGHQKLMRLTYKDAHNDDTYEVFATLEHDWIVEDSHKKRTKTPTKDIRIGERLSVVTARSNGLDYLSPQGIQHGIVYGDGCTTEHDCHIDLIGNSCTNLREYFKYNRYNELPNVQQPAIHVSGMPSYYKQLPSLSENRPYLLGFLAGWIAADGWVAGTTMCLSNKSSDVLEFARSIANICGIRASKPRLMRDTNPYNGEPSELWYISFYSCDRTDKLVIRQDHKDKYKPAANPRSQKYCVVTSIEQTDITEEVYCAQVPETHTFVIDGCVLTGNCWNSAFTDRFSRHFTFLFERLMEGGGVGANYSNKYLKHYKPFRRTVDLHFVSDSNHKDYPTFNGLISDNYSPNWTGAIVISDDREGWVAALEALLDAYYSDGEEPVTLVFDVSIIRPRGARIKGFGGSASGPKALMDMLQAIADLLNQYRGQKPSSLLCMDVDHLIASCVVAGNVRRSARMSMKYWLDADIFEFIACKERDPITRTATKHWTTNISVVVDNAFFRAVKRADSKHHDHATKVIEAIAQGMMADGEPGIYNIDKASEGELSEAFCTNPCGEIAFSDPFEQCNLGHINLAAFIKAKQGKGVVDEANLYSAMRLMTRFLIRATYADIPDEEARHVVNKNRRIGVGFFGLHEFVVMQGKRYSECHTDKDIRRILKKCYQVVRKEARDYAFELRIPEPIKVTTCAPTGSVAKLPGTSEGAQGIFAPYFIRTVCYATNDQKQIGQLAQFAAQGYHIEDSVYTPDTQLVSFYVKDPLVDKVIAAGFTDDIVEGQYDVHLQDQLAVQTMIQECYSDNAVSFTANFLKSDYNFNDIIEALKMYGPRVKGCTLNPDVNDRPQTPYTAITKDQYDNFTGLKSVSQAEIDCPGGVCPIK